MPQEQPFKTPIWVVVRVDRPIDQYNPESLGLRITLVDAFPERSEADAEVERLNQLNADKGFVYFSAPTRYFPSGRHVQKGY